MRVEVRPFRDDDYPALIGLANRVEPDERVTEEEVRYADAALAADDCAPVRFVAVDADGMLLGAGAFGHVPLQYHPRKYGLDVRVDPDRRRCGIGGRLYARLEAELRARDALAARSWVKESRPDAIAFLTRRGFGKAERTWQSRLDVGAVDLGRFAGAEERLAARGIAIATLAAERARDPSAVGRTYELCQVCGRDIPAIDPITPIGRELFDAFLVEGPRALPEAFFLAADGERYVGVSMMIRSEGEPGVLHQILTGVLPEYRGCGIARALKVRTVAYAREHGFHEIRTDNSTLNAPMLRINEDLGFVKQPVVLTLQKSLATT